jgi:hypothetical protein
MVIGFLRAGEKIAPGVPKCATTSKALCRGHNTYSYRLSDRGLILRVLIRSANTVRVIFESESWYWRRSQLYLRDRQRIERLQR